MNYNFKGIVPVSSSDRTPFSSFGLTRILIAILLIFSHPERVISQISDSLYRLDEVSIVTDRLGQSSRNSGRHVSIITASEIRELPVNSIDELLRYVPFVEVQSRGPYGAQSDILLRGSTFNQVLVMIDGMRINDPLTGHFNGNIPVALEDISRIEVYRGPASFIYGADAVGGVINIISKTFSREEESDGFSGTFNAWYGQHRLIRTNSGLQFRKGGWKASAGFSHNSSEGHSLSGDSLRGDFRISTGSLALSGKLSENVSLGLRTALDSRLFNAMYFYTTSPFDQSRENVERWWNQARLDIRLNDASSLVLLTGYQATRDSFLFNPAFPANIHKSTTFNQQLNYQYIPGNGFRLSAGIQALLKSVNSTDRGDHIHRQGGLYITASREFLNNFTMGGGIRLEMDEVYGAELLPQLNTVWSPDLWTFRFSAGRSIRSPDFTEQYVSKGLEGPLSPGRNLGNPGLVAERSWSIEAGADRMILQELQFRMTGFYRFGRELIDYIMTPAEKITDNGNLTPGAEYFYAVNIGSLNTAGFEAGLNGNHRFNGRWMMDWDFGWQILQSISDSAVVSKYLATHAWNLLQMNLGINYSGFIAGLNGMYKTRESALAEAIGAELKKSYLLINLRLNKTLLSDRFILSVQVNNVLDMEYSDFLGAKMPGRWISGGVTWNFRNKF